MYEADEQHCDHFSVLLRPITTITQRLSPLQSKNQTVKC